jgi:acyl carrier protein
VVPLDELPLTRHGKVDVRRLPAPDRRRAGPVEFVPPRTDAEALVADVWSEVLDLEKVGALDDFFTIGGHSLHATRVAARLRAVLDVDVPIRTLFTHTTVTALATALEELLVADVRELSDDEASRRLDPRP